MVFFFHEYPGSAKDPFTSITSIGWTGVDLFFVLSGFLITGILYDTLHDPHYFRNFYARRGLRLFPIYIVVVGFVLAINYALGGRPTVWALPYFVYGSNIVRNLGKATGIAAGIDVSHFWSLGVEEQFYLIWPLIIFCARKKRHILWICGTGSLLALALRWLVAGNASFPQDTSYLELPMRLDSLLFGGIVAILLRSGETTELLTRARINWGIFAGAAILALSIAASRSASPYTEPMVRYGYFGASILFASVIALATDSTSWAYRLGSVSLLRTFGRYSYGLYLIHFIASPEIHHIYDLLKQLTGTKPGSTNLVGHLLGVVLCFAYLATLLGVAAICYHGIELPLLRMKRYFAYSDEQKSHLLQPDQATVVVVRGA